MVDDSIGKIPENDILEIGDLNGQKWFWGCYGNWWIWGEILMVKMFLRYVKQTVEDFKHNVQKERYEKNWSMIIINNWLNEIN